MNLTLFYFWFSVSVFFILDLNKEYDVKLYVIVTQVTNCDRSVAPIIGWSHISQLQVTQSHDIKKVIKDSKIGNII